MAAFLVAVVPGCVSGSSDAVPEATPSCSATVPVSSSQLKAMPRKIPLDDWGVVTEVREQRGFLGATAIADTTIVELYPEVVRTLTGSGYALLGGDNEGFEAEITLRSPKDRLTTFTMQMGECDEVIVRMLVELEAGE